MEPVTLITTALTLATPYLKKAGEKIAVGVGEDIWKLIKKPFSKKDEVALITDVQTESEKEKLKVALLEKINSDSTYKLELENAVEKGQKILNEYYQQNINNSGNIEKQINIQENKGNIQM